jgi:hypothetical protein
VRPACAGRLLTRAGRLQAAVQVLADLRLSGLQMNRTVYLTAIQKLALAGQPDLVVSLVDVSGRRAACARVLDRP